MIPLAAKLLLGGLGLAGLLAIGSAPANAAPAKAGGGIPADLAQRMVAALALGDPAGLRKVAGELRARGFTEDAAKLEKEADRIEKAKGTSTPSTPSTSTPSTGTPGVFPGTTAGPESDSKQLAAAAVARAPTDATKVRLFQTQEGLVADGKYGPKTATALIKYGFVPPTPTAWPADGGASRVAYVALLKVQAGKDAVRREEWQQAATAAAGPLTAATSTSSSSSSATAKPSTAPTLRQGASGANVEFLQRLLNQNGAAIKVDGKFGSGTTATVRDFQSKRKDPATGAKLVVDGVVGPATWRALGAFK